MFYCLTVRVPMDGWMDTFLCRGDGAVSQLSTIEYIWICVKNQFTNNDRLCI